MMSVALGLAALAGVATARVITDDNVENENVGDSSLRGVTVDSSSVNGSAIAKAHIDNAHLHGVSIEDSTVLNSYISKAELDRVSVEDSRIAKAHIEDADLRDVTLCQASLDAPEYNVGEDCELVSTADGKAHVHARLLDDAPERVAPNESYEIRAWFDEAGTLVVRNDPAALSALGFDTTAADAAVGSIEVWADDEQLCDVALGESCDLQGNDEVMLKVNVASTGIVDGATLGLVLDVGGHGLRTAMTTFDVMATQLAFAPIEAQAFAPFLSDNVARLVISVATDEHGNVDRDLDVAYTVNVTDVEETDGIDVVGDIQHHGFLHGDSEFFSDEPFKYTNPTSLAAHHPATLELILRDMVGIEGITFGAASFYATHLVTQSPFPTTVELTASTTNAEGEHLEAGPIEIELAELPEEPRSASTPFGPLGDPMFPGRGTLDVRFVDDNGEAVEAEDGWILMIQETPESHQVQAHIALDGEGTTFQIDLAASEPVGLPFGDFVPHEYLVCVHHDGETDCANDGDLIAIANGETTAVEINVG